ncbi:hypothetical protein BT93_I0713 [Corymbia citriodora subsp. variegata]|nr:hypothetical protein BT93_I0713 [Corymbia citriodora subsp. variegata]
MHLKYHVVVACATAICNHSSNELKIHLQLNLRFSSWGYTRGLCQVLWRPLIISQGGVLVDSNEPMRFFSLAPKLVHSRLQSSY